MEGVNKAIKIKWILSILVLCGMNACGSAPKKMDVAAPLPPVRNVEISSLELSGIDPSAGAAVAETVAAAQKDCGFSSFNRKYAMGYEFDESAQLGLKASPDFDIWNPKDFDVKVKLTFTKSFGGPANKRPNCTFGSGFYGLVPYVVNKGVNLEGLSNPSSIKSFVQEKLEERHQRRKEREQKAMHGI